MAAWLVRKVEKKKLKVHEKRISVKAVIAKTEKLDKNWFRSYRTIRIQQFIKT